MQMLTHDLEAPFLEFLILIVYASESPVEFFQMQIPGF